jgi:hypothetical protein
MSMGDQEQNSVFPFRRVVTAVMQDELAKWKHRDVVHYGINCLMCNVVFRVTEKQLDRKFCGNRCKYASLATEHRGEDHFKRSGQWIGCRVCGKKTWVKQSRIDAGKGKCCSKECFLKEHPLALRFPDVTRTCLHCGDEFTCKESDKTQHCSVRCGTQASYDTRRHPPVDGRNNGRFGKPPKYMKYDVFTDRLGRTFRLRSSYEIAFVEQHLDRCGLTWDYEPQTFDLGDISYTPDFWVEELQTFVEAKGYMRPKARAKMELFRKLNPTVSLIVATEDVLCGRFGLDLSKETIKDIQCRYNAKTYIRRDQREVA